MFLGKENYYLCIFVTHREFSRMMLLNTLQDHRLRKLWVQPQERYRPGDYPDLLFTIIQNRKY